jgi:hypothetical protein
MQHRIVHIGVKRNNNGAVMYFIKHQLNKALRDLRKGAAGAAGGGGVAVVGGTGDRGGERGGGADGAGGAGGAGGGAPPPPPAKLDDFHRQGLGLLHWAAFYGSLKVVRLLLRPADYSNAYFFQVRTNHLNT